MPAGESRISNAERGLARTSSASVPHEEARSVQRAPPDEGAFRGARVEALRRLESVARLAFEVRRLSRINRISAPGASDQAYLEVLYEIYGPSLAAELRRSRRSDESFQAYRTEVLEPRLGQIREAYDADLAQLIPAVEELGWLWLLRALNQNTRVLSVLRFELLAPREVEALHRAAVRYTSLRARLIHGTPATDPLGRAREEYRALERAALERVDHPVLSLLFTLPRRATLVSRLAAHPSAARAALEEVFDDASSGIDEFGDEITEDRTDVWRYPHIVCATVSRLVAQPGNPASNRNMTLLLLNLARDISGSAWGQLAFVAGTAVAAVAFAWTPVGWAAAGLALIDSAISGLTAYHTYRRERQNDLARSASVFGEGRPFSDRPTNYGSILVDTAAALLSAVLFLRGARAALSTELESGVQLVDPPRARRAADDVLEEAAPIESVLERNAAPAERLATPPEMLARQRSIGRVREPAETTRTQSALESLGQAETAPPSWRTATARPPLETTEEFLRSLGRYGRHPRVPLTPEEAAIFRTVRIDEWDRVLAYARSNAASPQAVFMVKGKIQEILIERLPEFQHILERALSRAGDLGIPARAVRFVTGLSERSRELMDAAILAIHEDRLYVLSVFESKAQGNISDLVTRGSELGQFLRDLTRLSRGDVRIGAVSFEPSAIVAGGELTEWVAVLPRDRSLSPESVRSIREEMGNLTVVQAPVRDEALESLSVDALKLAR